MDAQAHDPQAIYRITVRGRLDASWSEWFSGFLVAGQQSADGALVTVLTGPVADQPALRGLLNRLWDLNLILLAVRQLGTDASCPEADR